MGSYTSLMGIGWMMPVYDLHNAIAITKSGWSISIMSIIILSSPLWGFAHASWKQIVFCNIDSFSLQSHCIGSGAIMRLPHGPFARNLNLRVAHATGMPWTFSPPPRVNDLDIHHGTCVTHVPWCMPGSLTSGFLWSLRRGKRSRHSRRMRNPHFYVSGKRPIVSQETMNFADKTSIKPQEAQQSAKRIRNSWDIL